MGANVRQWGVSQVLCVACAASALALVAGTALWLQDPALPRHVALWVVASVLWVMAALKAFQQVWSTCRLRRYLRKHGAKFDDWLEARAAGNDDPRVSSRLRRQVRQLFAPGHLPVSHHLIRLPGAWGLVVADVAFTWPVIVLAQALLLFLTGHPAVVAVGVVMELVCIWVGLATSVFVWVLLGPLVAEPLGSTSRLLLARYARGASARMRTSKLLNVVALQLASVGSGYAAIYAAMLNRADSMSGMCSLAPHGPLSGIAGNPDRIVQCLYFSVQVLGTVCCGDIRPQTLAAQAVMGTEVLASFVLLFYFVSMLSLVSQDTRRAEHPRA